MEGPHGMCLPTPPPLPQLVAVIPAAGGGSTGFLKRRFQVTSVLHLLLVFL